MFKMFTLGPLQRFFVKRSNTFVESIKLCVALLNLSRSRNDQKGQARVVE